MRHITPSTIYTPPHPILPQAPSPLTPFLSFPSPDQSALPSTTTVLAPKRSAGSGPVSTPKRKRHSQNETPQSSIGSQAQEDFNSNLSVTTTNTLQCTQRVIRGLPASRRSPSQALTLPLHCHQTMSQSLGGPVDSLRQQSPASGAGEPLAKRRRLDGGQSPGGVDIVQEQEQPTTDYQTRQHAHQTQLDWHGGGAQQAMSQLPLLPHGYPPIYDAPSHHNPTYPHVHALSPTWSPTSYPTPSTTPQWTNGGQDQYNYGPGTGSPVQPVQVQGYIQSRPISPTHIPLIPTHPSANAPLSGSFFSPSAVHSNTGASTPEPPLVLPRFALPFPGEPSGTSLGPNLGPNPSLLPGSISSDAAVRTASGRLEGPWPAVERPPFNRYHHQGPSNAPQYNPPPCPIPSQYLLPFYQIPTGDPFSCLPPHPYPTTPIQDPNPDVVRNGCDINYRQPMSPELQLDQGTCMGREFKSYPRKRPVKYEGNLGQLQERCRRQGADEGAIGLLGRIFAHKISLKALTRSFSDAEVETRELGCTTGKVYTALIRPTREEGGADPRFVCRLCYGDQSWKHIKDVLRHLRRDHVGLADICEKCDRSFYTTGEKGRHPCKPPKRT